MILSQIRKEAVMGKMVFNREEEVEKFRRVLNNPGMKKVMRRVEKKLEREMRAATKAVDEMMLKQSEKIGQIMKGRNVGVSAALEILVDGTCAEEQLREKSGSRRIQSRKRTPRSK
ncbi:MAG: hypothetical protein V1696_00470 [Candidatus Jorgensenbacteria bacterium]